MTSQRGEHISTEQEKEDENFYDCQETIEVPDGAGGAGERQEKRGNLEDLNTVTDRLTDVRVNTQEEEQVNGLQEDKPGEKLQAEEDQVNASLDDSDSELKENGKEVEFDDEYLREVEKELTQEEKEVTPSIYNLQFRTMD